MADSIAASKIHSHYVNNSDILYGILRSITGTVRDVTNEAWDAWPGPSQSLADHDISSGSASGNLWIGGFPELASTFYIYEVRKRIGGAPNTDDPVISIVKAYWNGTEFGVSDIDASGRMHLAPDGLNDIVVAEFVGYPSSFVEGLRWLIMRWVNEHVYDTVAGTLKVKKSDGNLSTTQTVSDINDVETVEKAT